jgi:hypothetical protein
LSWAEPASPHGSPPPRGRKPSPPLPLLPPLTPQRSFGPLALIPRSTVRKPWCVFSYSLNTFPVVALLVSHVYIPLCRDVYERPSLTVVVSPTPFALFIYSHYICLFRRWLPARWVPIPPRRRPWIGWHQRPRAPSPIFVCSSGEARDNPSPKRNRIPLTIRLHTIREHVQILLYERTAHILGPSTKMVIAAGRQSLGPWRLPKKEM